MAEEFLTARLERMDAKLDQMVELMAAVAQMQERDRHMQDDIDRSHSKIAELVIDFNHTRKNNEQAHELFRAELNRMNLDFHSSRQKCDAVGTKFDSHIAEFKTLNTEVDKYRNIGIGIALVGGILFWVAQVVVTGIKDDYLHEKEISQKYREMNDARELETMEQLKMITQQLRSLKK